MLRSFSVLVASTILAGCAVQPAPEPQVLPSTAEAAEPAPISPRCEEELLVAQRAREARGKGDPLDRLLRIQEIAFQEPTRRARLEKVATYWFKLPSEPSAEDLRDSAIRNCLEFK